MRKIVNKISIPIITLKKLFPSPSVEGYIILDNVRLVLRTGFCPIRLKRLRTTSSIGARSFSPSPPHEDFSDICLLSAF